MESDRVDRNEGDVVPDPPPPGTTPWPDPPPKAPHYGFLTVTGTVVFSPADGQAHSAGQPQSILLTTDERPFFRPRFKVGPGWRPLELGWFDVRPPSLMVLENHRRRFDVRPSPEEDAEADSLVVELALAPAAPDGGGGVRTMHSPPTAAPEPEPFAVIRPGRDARIEPLNAPRLLVRCPAGTAVCSLHLFPR